MIPEALKQVKLVGGYSDPKIIDLLGAKVILLPLSILRWIYKQIRYKSLSQANWLDGLFSSWYWNDRMDQKNGFISQRKLFR